MHCVHVTRVCPFSSYLTDPSPPQTELTKTGALREELNFALPLIVSSSFPCVLLPLLMNVCCVLLLSSCHRGQPYKSELAQLCLCLWCHLSQTWSSMSLEQTFLFHLQNKMKIQIKNNINITTIYKLLFIILEVFFIIHVYNNVW